MVRNLRSPPLAWEQVSILYLSHCFSLEPHPDQRGEPFTTWKMSKAAIPIFVCFLLNLAQNPGPSHSFLRSFLSWSLVALVFS